MTETVTVTASAVRAELTRLLAAVSDGKRVEITKHGKVVAAIVTAEAEVEAETEAEVLLGLFRGCPTLFAIHLLSMVLTFGGWPSDKLLNTRTADGNGAEFFCSPNFSLPLTK